MRNLDVERKGLELFEVSEPSGCSKEILLPKVHGFFETKGFDDLGKKLLD